MPWDPDRYLAFADERALPFHHLVAAVASLSPDRVLDAGCGPGALTATLAARWPAATVLGIDSSVEMIELALRRARPPRLDFALADITTWSPDEPLDLLLSNACFHWIEDHRALLARVAGWLAPHGTLAFQVPANHDRPSHRLLAELCASDRWRDHLQGAFRVHVREPDWYADELERLGLSPTVWQTTYRHRLTGADPVLEWVRGTTLRTVLDRLERADRDAFLGEFGALLRRAYPARNGVTVFPFTRTFVAAQKR